jgi:ABC-type Fe3+-hydroxamate transport system substrate-binding protein
MKTILGDIPLATDFVLPQLPRLVDGQVYQVDSQMGMINVMTNKTYLDLGTMCESLRQMARHMERKMREQNQQLDTAQRVLADVSRKYKDLREKTSADRRAQMESLFKPGVKTGS